jgi:hypothetical protein
VKIMENTHDIYLKNIPSNLEERYSKNVRSRSLITIQSFHHLKYPIFLKRSLQPNGLILPNGTKERPSNLGLQLCRSVNKLL